MSLFSDSLKKWFYHNDSVAAKAGTRICLLDASGNPAGSDEILRALTFAQCQDDYVDMGLPSGTLWAKKNLGAVSETDYGMYVSWGNLELHPAGDGYNFSDNAYSISPAAAIIADLTLDQDIAHIILGGGWRMPTDAECVELFSTDYTTNTWTTDYQGISGLNGRLITSKSNGNTLFLPASGRFVNSELSSVGTNGYWWSSSVESFYTAVGVLIGSGIASPSSSLYRRNGLCIRPVI